MRTNRNMIGRLCMVRDRKRGSHIFVEALMVGPHRVRLQTGENFGELREKGEFDVMEFIAPGDAPSALAMAMA